jgi:PAS domain S-box-containing protein
MKKTSDEQRKAPAKQRGAAKPPDPAAAAADLRSRAESSLPKPRKAPKAGTSPASDADTRRLLHELQVHQIELEMQNSELQECRHQAESLLEKYVELYDFAPVGYFSLDANGRILEVNLTGAALLGVARSLLISRSLLRFAEHSHRAALLDLLAKVFAGSGKHVIEARFRKDDGTTFWGGLHASPAFSSDLGRDVCRMAVSDITVHKQAEEARRRVELLTHLNEALEKEIVRRQAVEDSLRISEQQQHELLEQSRSLQQQLREMSRGNLLALETERSRISQDLHDDIAQTLVGINVQLEALARRAEITPKVLRQDITRTQRLVSTAVKSILRFAVDLRPTSLDDLGLSVSLNVLLDDFMKRTGIRVHFKTYAGGDHLSRDQRTTLYRIAQTALSNVAEHSQATQVELRISETADAVYLDITDNGNAFDVSQPEALQSSQHLGLTSMRERAEMAGGTCRIESEPGKGTTLHVQIPV